MMIKQLNWKASHEMRIKDIKMEDALDRQKFDFQERIEGLETEIANLNKNIRELESQREFQDEKLKTKSTLIREYRAEIDIHENGGKTELTEVMRSIS